jgi:hypothetical protein
VVIAEACHVDRRWRHANCWLFGQCDRHPRFNTSRNIGAGQPKVSVSAFYRECTSESANSLPR